jgi:hypothetical protein
MLALTSPTSGGRSVGIVLSRTQATEFSFFSFRLEKKQKERKPFTLQPVLTTEGSIQTVPAEFSAFKSLGLRSSTAPQQEKLQRVA